MVEVVTLTSTFTYARKYGVTGVLDRDVTDQLHHVYGFTYTRTTEQTHFTALRKRTHQVDNFDAGFQQFLRAGQLFVGRCRAVNSPTLFFTDVAFHVDGLTQYVHDTTQCCFTYRDFDRMLKVFYFQTTTQTVGRTHRDGTHDTAAELLLNFQHQALVTILYLKRVVHAWYGVLRELDVHHGADYLDNLSSSHLESST